MTMTKLSYIFAQITSITKGHHHTHGKGKRVKLSTKQVLFVKDNNRKIPSTFNEGEYCWVSFNPKTMLIDKASKVSESTAQDINIHFENLRTYADKATKALEDLEQADRHIILRCAGMAASGFVAVGAAATTIGSAMAWEPTTAVTSGIVAAGAGYITYLQYEELKPAMKRRVDTLKRFQQIIITYKCLMELNVPEAWINDESNEYVYASEPEVEGITTKLIRLFPNLHWRDLMPFGNDVNWSYA